VAGAGPARALQPIAPRRVALWPEINDLPNRGGLSASDRLGSGSVPSERLFVQHDGSLGSAVSERISMLPLTHNADSFAYRPERLPAGFSSADESCGWLVDPAWCGRVALQSDAAIGAQEAARDVRGAGRAQPGDRGNLSTEESDVLANILVRKQGQGMFGAFWSDDEEAAELMLHPTIDIQSLWSPTLVRLHRAGVKYRVAVPREGYRGWFGGLSLSRHAKGAILDAAYAYLNWWLSGWPGAVMARQGYYIGNPARSREHLSAAEWDYWYAGLPAREQLMGSDGLPLIDIGEVRDGGSYEQRMGHIAVWNAVMDEHNYLVRRWGDISRAGGKGTRRQ